MPEVKKKKPDAQPLKKAKNEQTVDAESAKKDWFKKGQDVFDAKRQIDVLAKSRKERSVSRFFLKAGDEAILVFVDSSPLENLGA